MSSNNTPNIAASINNTSTTTTPRTTSIEEITPKTATCTEQLLALAAASHASADMAASSTQEVDDDNQDEESTVKQLLPVTSPIKITNGPSTSNTTANNNEKAPTPDKAVSSNSQMSPTTATKIITEAQTPKHCNKSPYNTSTTTNTTTVNNTKLNSEVNHTTTNTVSGSNPIGKQLNPNPPARSKPIKQYWPTRYSTINQNERRIQAELGNYSTSYVEGNVESSSSKEREKRERDRMIRERDARDYAQRNYSQQQQRNIYEQQQQQYVNAHRNMYEKQPYGYGGSPPTHYHHNHQPMPQFVVPPHSRYSSGKYHYEGGYPPPHYEGYPPSHSVARGGYYSSPSNYQRQYNVAGYSAAQVATHHAPPQATYGNTTGGYGRSYQDKEVPLSTVPSTEDRSKDGSLHAVSSSFSNEGVVGSSKALMKSMQSPGVVTSNGSVGESTEERVIPNQPSLSKSSESKEEDDAVSWHQTKDEMLRLTMTKSELTDVSKVTDESSGVVQTEKQAEDTGVSKEVAESSSAVQTPKNTTAQQSSEEEKKPQDVEESDLKQVPSTLSHTSSLSHSPTDEQQSQQQQQPSSTRSSRAATHAIQHYENSMNEMMMGYHPRNMMYPPPPSHHVPSPHHYGHHHPQYHHPHAAAAYHYPPPQQHYHHTHPPPHMHPARLSNVHTAQGANPEDDNSPSASTISTKASLAVVPPVMVSNTPRSEGAARAGDKDGDLMHAHQLLSLSASKSNDDDVKPKQQVKSNSAVKMEPMAEPQDDEYANPPAKRRRKLSDISMNPSPTALALDNRPSPTDSATNQSQQSHQSLELGAMPSWDTAGAGRPLAGWSVCSGMGSTGGHSFGNDVHNLLGSAFSFSDSVLNSTTGGSGEEGRPGSSGSSADDQDPSPKSILSKIGEKRKSLAPGTHVQFSTSSSSSHGGRKRGLSSSQQAPPPMSHEEYAYYQSRHPGYTPSYHSSTSHRGAYHEEDPYYGSRNYVVSSAAAAEYVRPQFQQDRRRPESSVPSSSSKSKSKIPAPQFINVHGTTMAAPGGGYWTKEEDSTLMDLMKKKTSLKDWGPMTSRLNKACGGNKIPGDVQERWVRYLKPGSRKGQWTKEEDNIVREAVEQSNENPYTRWSDLSRELPGRVGKQVRDRWVNHLNPALSHEPFSREDDLMLWEGHHNIGKRWTVISSKVFKGSRSENHIKNRWYSAAFKKFIAKEFGDDAYKLVNSGQTSADVVAVTGLVSHPKSKQQKPDQQEDEHFTVVDGQTSKRKRIAYAGEIIDR